VKLSLGGSSMCAFVRSRAAEIAAVKTASSFSREMVNLSRKAS
jgi:hypothetical protein